MKKLPLLITLVLFLGNLQAQITADFTTQPYDNCGGAIPVTVVFIDQSTSPGGSITDWVWDFDDGNTSQQSSPTHTYTGAGTGNYTICLTVTNSAGESDTECKTNYVSISDIPVCTILTPDNLDCNVSTVTLDGSLSTIGANIIYEWRDANFNFLGTNPTLNVSAPGFYTLNVSEAINGCSAEATVEVVTDYNLPILHIPVTPLNDTIYNCQEDIYYSADLVDPSCTNCSIEIRDAGNMLICNSLPCVYDISAFMDMTGTIAQHPFYLSAVNNQNGCYVTELLPTPDSASYSIFNNITNESCNGMADGSIDLTASGANGPYNYDWEDLPGTSDPLDRTGLTAGIYTLNITDAFGCDLSAPDGFEYEVESYPIADASATDNVDTLYSCTTPSITLPIFLDASNSSTGPNLIYRWYDSDFILVGDSIVSEVNSFSMDGYTLIVTDTVVQCSNSTMIVWDIFEDFVVPTAVINSPDELTCLAASVTINGSGSSTGPDITYEWVFNGIVMVGETSPTVTVTESGVYELIVTNITNGCSASAVVLINENITPPTADAGPDMILTCSNLSVTLDGSGSSTGSNIAYEWLDQNGTGIYLTLNPTVSTPGVYTLVVTDIDNGCTASDQLTVTEDSAVPALNINATTVTCPDDMVMIDLFPGCINCSVEILDNMGNPVCTTGLPCEIDPADGPFQIIITDLNTGCQNVESFSFSVPSSIEISSAVITNPTCSGENNGSIDLEVIGGSPPYNYIWFPVNQFTEDIVNLTAGIYTVTITDVNGCTIEEDFTVANPDPLEITNVQITNVSCTATDDGSIDVTVSGGTGNYSYEWSNASTNTIISDLTLGIYSVIITDSNGCSVVSPDYEIIQNACFNFANDTTICVGGIVPLSNDLPTTGWTYSWSPAIGINDPSISNPIASPVETTTYFLTITDVNGMVIFNGEGPTVTVQNYIDFDLLDFSNSPLCEGDTLELYGNMGLVFAWTGPNNFSSSEMNPELNDVTESQGGIYSLTMTDDFGCSAMTDVDVFIDDDCVWPGDTDTNLVVNHFDLLNIGLAYDSVGTIRENASFNWLGQPSLDWSQTTPTSNVNYKHIDADGNGIIEAADTVAITQNFGLTHNFSDPDILNQFTDLPPTDGVTVVTPFYIEPDTLIEGETIALDLILGDVSNLVIGLYGIGFSIEYDSSVVVPGSASINFDNCWLGDVDADAISIQFDFPNPGRIDAAITRIDGMEMDGYGLFGELIITLEDDILLWDGSGGSNNFGEPTTDVTADFTVTNYHLINFSQEEILVEGMTTTSPVGGTTSLSLIKLDELISVFPNPTSDVFFIASQKLDIERVRIFSATGELKSVKTKTGNNLEFSTKELASGVYFIEIQTREGIVTKKLNIL